MVENRFLNLYKQELQGKDLENAKLSNADMRKANLGDTNLSRAVLSDANLSDADLSFADLSGADLSGADLIGANLNDADLRNADLRRADLSNADLSDANLSDADLSGTFLFRANLSDANLSNANLRYASLVNVRLSDANLSNANLSNANLSDAYFYPKLLPNIRLIAQAEGLSTLRFDQPSVSQAELRELLGLPVLRFDQPAALVELRDAFKKAGFRRQEREVTFALNRVRDRTTLEGAFRFVFFEVTCQWGMWPGLSLWILLGLVGVFSVPYMFALSLDSKIFGIWRVWSNERILEQFGSKKPERLKPAEWRIPFWALYFSILSAFHFGWKDLNVGSWIARIQRREYTLRATGWVRVVSGLQSLTSVYLLAIWALTYFGRPFE